MDFNAIFAAAQNAFRPEIFRGINQDRLAPGDNPPALYGTIDNEHVTVEGGGNLLTDAMNGLNSLSRSLGLGDAISIINSNDPTPDGTIGGELGNAVGGQVEEFVSRGAILILGLIFVAVGLSMFRPAISVQG